tara:strand:+ start:423 stop:854 length:432 start_codon:yes stop_codon:yes gene_type:complete
MSHRWRYYKGYWRFQNIAVPQGATIETASFKVYWEAGSSRTFKVIALDNDDAPQPTNNTYADHSLETTASADWTIDNSEGAYTVEVKTIIQEIVDRSGWSSGNAIMLMVRLDETNNNLTKDRDANMSEAVVAAQRPELTITYS